MERDSATVAVGSEVGAKEPAEGRPLLLTYKKFNRLRFMTGLCPGRVKTRKSRSGCSVAAVKSVLEAIWPLCFEESDSDESINLCAIVPQKPLVSHAASHALSGLSLFQLTALLQHSGTYTPNAGNLNFPRIS
jgi:hypothetical protein